MVCHMAPHGWSHGCWEHWAGVAQELLLADWVRKSVAMRVCWMGPCAMADAGTAGAPSAWKCPCRGASVCLARPLCMPCMCAGGASSESRHRGAVELDGGAVELDVLRAGMVGRSAPLFECRQGRAAVWITSGWAAAVLRARRRCLRRAVRETGLATDAGSCVEIPVFSGAHSRQFIGCK